MHHLVFCQRGHSYESSPDDLLPADRRLTAYWHYQGMEDKNMLTQSVHQLTYDTDLSLGSDFKLYDYATSESDIIAGRDA